MKKLLFIIFLLFPVDASAFILDWQTISGSRTSGIYHWNYSYEIGYFDDEIKVDLDIRPYGYTSETDIYTTWERGIENIWSTDRFDVPISVNVDWVEENYDQQLLVMEGNGRSYMTMWYVDAYNPDKLAAHEAGHMFGVWDEYYGGAVNPYTGLTGTEGLMNTLYYPTLDYYYDEMLGWYNQQSIQLASIHQPEPMTMILFGIGLIGMFITKEKLNGRQT